MSIFGWLRPISVLFLFVTVISCLPRRNEVFRRIQTQKHREQPLILTPYIKANQIDTAKKLSSIEQLPYLNIKEMIGHSGYLTVNQSCNGNLFFYFKPHEDVDKPILLWLEGGPGAASTFTAFVENGPYELVNRTWVRKRQFAWTNEFHMLFIDSPVGTGYSFGDSDDCYSRDEQSVASNLYEALKQFFTMFAEYKNNPFFLTGESYAGKYVPALGYHIHQNLDESRDYFNFTGIGIGNAMIDPYSQMDYGVHLHASGLIDQNQEIQINKTIHKIQKLISMKQFDQAFKLFVPLVFNSDSNSMLYNFTGQLFHYNVLVDSVPQLVIDFNDFMQDPQVRRAFHVYPNNFNENDKVGQMMKSDILKSIKHKFALLANNYPTILWSGQLDIIIPPLFTENFLNQLDWKYSDTFATADRLVWRLEDEKEKVAGYVKQVNNFWYVVVKRAGHMVPWDQPKVAFEMIKKFVYDSI